MHHLSMKEWMRGMHMPGAHDLGMRMDHLIHDEHFWQIVHILALLAVLIMFAFWSGSPVY